MNQSHMPHIVLQPRDRRLLEELGKFRVIDREQASVIGPFGSVTRANTRLLLLTKAGLLTRIPVGTIAGGHRYLYARTRHGAAAVGDSHRNPPWNAHSPIVAGQPLLEHQLQLNKLYLTLTQACGTSAKIWLNIWRPFSRPPVPDMPGLIPDAYVQFRGDTTHAFFVEVDLATEPTRTWAHKTDRYLALARSGRFTSTFGVPTFGVLVLVPSERRLFSLRKTISTKTQKLFYFATFASMTPQSVWSPIWWRPSGDAPVALIS